MHHRVVSILTVAATAAFAFADAGCSRSSRSTRHLEQANQLYTAGRYDEAEIAYKNAYQLNPNNPLPISRLGMIYQDEGRSGQALPFLLKARDLQPNDVASRAKLGLALLAVGNLPDARKEALFVLDHAPEDAEAPLLLAETSSTTKEIEAARQRLSNLPAAVADRAPVLVARGQLEIRAHRLQDAEALLQKAVAADPKSANAHAALAMIYWSRRDTAAAEDAYRKAAEYAPVRSPRRLQYAQFKLQTGDIAGAKAILDDIIKAAPDYVSAILWRAEIALAEKKTDEAETLVGKVLARDGMHPEALLVSARVQIAKGDGAKAVTTMEKMTGLYPQSPIGFYQLGIAYQTRGDQAKAREALTRAVSLAPELTSAAMALSELNIRSGRYGAAIATLKPLAQQRPDASAVLILLADAYRGSGDLDNALAIYRDLEQRLPTNAQIPFLRGMVLRQQNQREAARTAFTRALELNPDNTGAVEQLIDLDLAARQYDAARQRVDALIARSPKSPAPRMLLAKIEAAQRNIPGAEAALQQAIALQPDANTAYLALAQLYVASNQYAKAVTRLQESLAKNPNDARTLLILAILQDTQKDYPAARDSYEKVLALTPNSALALNNLAYLYAERLGQLDKAYELAQRARAQLNDDPRAADTIGWVFSRKGDYAAALSLLQDSAAKLPDEPEVQYHLGATLYQLGQEPAARTALENAVKSGATFNGSEDARQRLAILAINPAQPRPGDRELVAKALASRPDDSAALCRMAAWYRRDGDLAKAKQSAEAAVKASPRNFRAMMQLAEICAARGERTQAIEIAKDARGLAADDPEASYLLGRLVYGAGEYRWAASLLRDAADRLSDNAEVQFDWALAAYAVGQVGDASTAADAALKSPSPFSRTKEARQFLDLVSLSAAPAANSGAQIARTLQADPTSVPALMAGAALSLSHGDAKAARLAYEKVLDRFPEFTPAQKALTLLYAADLQDVARAAALASRARQAYPSDPELAKAFGVIVYRQGDFGRAVTLLQESATTRTNDGELQFYLGMSQLQLKRSADSKRSLQRALELGLKDELAAQARKSLAALN